MILSMSKSKHKNPYFDLGLVNRYMDFHITISGLQKIIWLSIFHFVLHSMQMVGQIVSK